MNETMQMDLLAGRVTEDLVYDVICRSGEAGLTPEEAVAVLALERRILIDIQIRDLMLSAALTAVVNDPVRNEWDPERYRFIARELPLTPEGYK